MALNTCMTCKKTYKLDETNAVIFLYEDRTYMDNVLMTCDKGHYELLFFPEATERDRFLRNNDDLSIVREHSPDQDVIIRYQEVMGIELVKPVELTPRIEEFIQKLARLLAETPDDLLMEIFAQPPPKSKLPRRWT